jgi:Carboxypeptidase regulatory-like domain
VRTGTLTRAVGLAGAATLALAVSAAGQTVLGTVVERGGAGPVSGAMVRLVDVRGGTGSGWITREDGRFRLEAVPGTYDLVIERIGFERKVIEGLDLVAGGLTSIDVAVETAAIRLEGLTVEGSGRGCPRIDEGEATQVIWEEARKALTAATWTERQSHLQFNVLRWDRFIDAETGDVTREDWSDQQWLGTNSVTSLPPEDLEADGYVRTTDGGDHFYGPDAETLLSTSFLDSHCFRVVRAEEPGSPLIGLEFEPVESRELPDIRGTIWLDERDARLDKVEFRYTGLRGRKGRAVADGEVRFAELIGGRWFVRDWFIRVPQMERRGTARDPFREDVVRVHDVGSRVEQVRGEGVEWTSELARGSIQGAIFDSVSGQPLSRAEVRIAGRPGLVADALGRFTVERLPPGEYRVSFAHPRIDSLGVVPGWTSVAVAPGAATEVALTVPSWETLVELQCGDAGSIVGSVRDERGRPVPGASVTIEAEGEGSGDAPVRARTDRMGVYGLCGVGVPAEVRLVAQMGASTVTREVTVASPTDHMRENFVLTTSATEFRSSPLAGTVRPGLVGTVLRAGTRTPLEGALVELVDSEGRSVGRSLSDSEGTFRIRPSEAGTLRVRVERLGYASGLIGEPLDLSNGARRVEILLPEAPIELDPVMVVIDARVDRLEAAGFYARALTQPGVFLIRDDVDVLDPARTSDLLMRAPGMRLISSPGDFRRRVVFRSLALTEGEACYPSLFVDGELVQMGGVRSGRVEERFALDDPVPKSVDEFVSPLEIEGLELYKNPTVIPQRFIGLGSRCGAIVIWTRKPG